MKPMCSDGEGGDALIVVDKITHIRSIAYTSVLISVRQHTPVILNIGYTYKYCS